MRKKTDETETDQPADNGSACPNCGGEMVPDKTQDPDLQIDRRTRNAMFPAIAARYADQVRTKVDEHGVIVRCVRCGYQDRRKTAA